MADDERPQPDPAPEPEPQAPEPEESIEDLRAQLIEERAARTAYQETLNALSQAPASAPTSQPTPGYVPTAPPSASDLVRHIAQVTGTDEAQIAPWVPVLDAYFQSRAQPLITTIADRLDSHEVRLTKKDYSEIEKEVEQEFVSHFRAGTPKSRADLYEMVKARKLPELLAEKAAKSAAERKSRATATAASETETAGVQKAGPSPLKSRAPQKRDIEHMQNRDEKIAAVEQALDGILI